MHVNTLHFSQQGCMWTRCLSCLPAVHIQLGYIRDITCIMALWRLTIEEEEDEEDRRRQVCVGEFPHTSNTHSAVVRTLDLTGMAKMTSLLFSEVKWSSCAELNWRTKYSWNALLIFNRYHCYATTCGCMLDVSVDYRIRIINYGEFQSIPVKCSIINIMSWRDDVSWNQ